MDDATHWRLQQAHQRQRTEWDRIGRRLKRLTGKRSSDLLLHDPLLQPPFAAHPGHTGHPGHPGHPGQRMSGGQQVPIPMASKQTTQIRRNHRSKSNNFPAPNNPLELLVVGQQLQMHRPPGRRHVQLQGAPGSQPRQQIEEYVYFYPVQYFELDHWPPHGQQEPELVMDARFMAELLDELLMNAGNRI
ncbi:uncharacterized protein LOC6551616 [Drosophila erecta]|uniref:Uncharacterized protein n=1 Tax=Drosophila erecta TaxID=7220 RepID=B3NY02_DROER|nr:uncharacterized protein LOC6551616 [Drosophila erecta]EDV47523.1 uncharacterized protein Dere_GG19675 [Drosophila erecta]